MTSPHGQGTGDFRPINGRRHATSAHADQTETSADAAYRRLRDAILAGDLRPNERLVEEDLAEALGVSRTPVREALLRLKQEGRVLQRKGWVVRDHDPSEVLEYLEARAELESATAGLAATRIDDDTVARLEELLDEMRRAPHSHELNRLNSRFHALITEAGGNPLLASFARNTDINYWTFSTPVRFSEADNAVVDQQHRELLEAIKGRDAVTAARVAKEHVLHTKSVLARSLNLTPRSGW
ncbi:MAG: GntR family transcriptional regulator [Propioniciclava sp.]|uniref:GntR family transcriptional regulator n=1 Tax=Propioniciclava sp. TaxID=2038686 RepID=UPI0039E59D54